MSNTPLYSMDIETSSAAPLQSIGAAAYIAHPSTTILMMSYHPVGEPSPSRLWRRGDPVPDEIVWHVGRGGGFTGWNVMGFDRRGWRQLLVPLGFPEIDDDLWWDSMHLAAAANLPRSLEGAAGAVGVKFHADLKDSNRIRRITDQKRTPITLLPDGRVVFGDRSDPKLKPAQIAAYDDDMTWLCDRCLQDSLMEEQVLVQMPPWPDVKPWLAMPHIDMRINDRGVLFDVALAEGLASAAAVETRRLSGVLSKTTGGRVTTVNAIESLKAWLVDNGVELPSTVEPKKPEDEEQEGDDTEDADETTASRKSPWRLRKSDIADLLANPDIPEGCRLALSIRSEAAKSSLAKLRSMLASRMPNDRLVGAFTLGGAQQSLRWAGARWQPHNFVRDAYGNPDEIAEVNGLDSKKDKLLVRQLGDVALRTAIEVGRYGDADLMRMMYEMPRKDAQGRVQIAGVLVWMSRMMRRVISAPAGHLLLNGDFAQVEARITVWLSQQTDMLSAFANREDVYKVAASGIYKIAIELITKQMRQAGKVSILASGFGGGPKALMAMAYNYGLILSLAEATDITNAWREANAATRAYWYATDDAAAMAVMNPGREYPVPPLGLVSYFTYGDCLCCRLPSGRLLRYWQPRLTQEYWSDGKPKNRLSLSALTVKGKAVFRRSVYHTILCLGPDASVVTSNGVKRLVDVTLADRVWDGTEWVQHEGLLYRGHQVTLSFGGVPVTPEHKVLVDGAWIESQNTCFDSAARSYVQSFRTPYSTECAVRINTKLTKGPVFDLLNAGPNHRFTVIGDDGRLILVSNCENQVQAIAADMLGCVLENLEGCHLPAVLHVHDSASSEIKEQWAEQALPVFERAFIDMPSWTKGLPIAADCEHASRFG